MSQVAYVSNIGEQGQSVSETTAERSPETTQRMAETTEDPLKDFKGFLLVLKSCRATVRPFATSIIDHSVDLVSCWVIETFVINDDGFWGNDAHSLPADDVGHFLKGAESARKDDVNIA